MSSLPPEATSSGDLLAGRYRLLDSLGTGGSSSVYRAWDEVDQAFRAVKILDGAVSHSVRVRERLLQEAELMSRLQHPNVVTVYQASTDAERVFLVMELLLGGSLMERIDEDGPLPPRMACTVMGGVLSALQCAHDHGVVHRDVKPHNVLLDGKGTPKVTDFGIARSDDAAMTRTGTVLGTMAFMPPEQKMSARRVDVRSDVYAAGATLFTLLTSRLPHDLYAVALDEGMARELYKGVPDPLVAVIRRATAFRMDERYASASAMQAATAAAVADLPLDPEGPPLVSPFRIGRARSRASLGPTLLGVTESAETTDLAKAATPTPAPTSGTLQTAETTRPPSPGVGSSGMGIALGLLGLLALGLVMALAWQLQLQNAPHQPPLVVLPAPEEPAEQAPALDTGEKDVTQRTRRNEPPEEPDETPASRPAPSVEDGKDTVRIGAWEVQRVGESKRRTGMLASLPASRDIRGSKGNQVRPFLVLSCKEGKLRGTLQTGMDTIELEKVVVRLDGLDLVNVTPHDDNVGELLLPRNFPAKMLETSQMEVTLGDGRYTTFTLAGIEQVKAECR